MGGNIIAVIHQREPDLDDDTLNVQIVLELPKGRLEKLVALLNEQGVRIQRIDEERLLYKRTVIMIGHLMHTDSQTLLTRLIQPVLPKSVNFP